MSVNEAELISSLVSHYTISGDISSPSAQPLKGPRGLPSFMLYDDECSVSQLLFQWAATPTIFSVTVSGLLLGTFLVSFWQLQRCSCCYRCNLFYSMGPVVVSRLLLVVFTCSGLSLGFVGLLSVVAGIIGIKQIWVFFMGGTSRTASGPVAGSSDHYQLTVQ